MSDRMIPPDFKSLLNEVLTEYKKSKSLMGIPVARLEGMNPIGPAAGPHTQLAGNLIAAFGAGASHFELKTVQVLEGESLGIQKPCILSQKEVYNTEWSTELLVEEAMNEYIKAFLIIQLLIKEFELGSIQDIAFIMSVGYDLAGISSGKIDRFINAMKDASHTTEWVEAITYLESNLDLFTNVTIKDIHNLSPQVSNIVTLSTLHGCPSHEIKSIGTYLLKEKGLHTYIKLNPTLIGSERVRDILDTCGYENFEYDQEMFEEDLKFKEAITMIEELKQIADVSDKIFGVKLTNTFPVKNKTRYLEGQTAYLSGPVLYPIAISVAAEISQALEGHINISYSGGADNYNIRGIVESGIYPITISSYLLKSGGYKNIGKMLKTLENMNKEPIDVDKIKALAQNALDDTHYAFKESKVFTSKDGYELLCAKCNNCVDVCPNRANRIVYKNSVKAVVHLDHLCNECGNCENFCIMGQKPYLDKWTIFNDENLYKTSANSGQLDLKKVVKYRLEGIESVEEPVLIKDYYLGGIK